MEKSHLHGEEDSTPVEGFLASLSAHTGILCGQKMEAPAKDPGQCSAVQVRDAGNQRGGRASGKNSPVE